MKGLYRIFRASSRAHLRLRCDHGCTAILCERGAVGGVDIRGSAKRHAGDRHA